MLLYFLYDCITIYTAGLSLWIPRLFRVVFPVKIILWCVSLTHTPSVLTVPCQVASVVSDSLLPLGLSPTRLLCPWDVPGKNTSVNCHFLLQVVSLTQGLNPRLLGLLHWQAGPYTVLYLYLKFLQVNLWVKVLCRGFFPFLKVIVKIENIITSSSCS